MKAWLLLFVLLISQAIAAEQLVSHGRFKDIRVHVPSQPAQQFVLYLADSPADAVKRASALSASGALVAQIDARAFFDKLERDDGECISPDGDLENLAHFIQALHKLPTYYTPILVGDGAAAAFVYAMLAQAPAETFAGGISVDFCPQLELRKPLCKDHRLIYSQANGSTTLQPAKLERRWFALEVKSNAACDAASRGFVQQVTGAPPTTTSLTRTFVSLARTVKPTFAPPPQQVSDLPLIEVPSTKRGDTFAILLSGDGGWAGLDKEVAAAIAAHGMPVVGVDSLRYFWNERTPESLARDVARIVRTYAQRWQRQRVVLIGYSQGADVLPFAINRLDKQTSAAVTGAVLIGLAQNAKFEFHVGNWLGLDEDEGLPTTPEVKRLRTRPLICIYGEDDEDSICGAFDEKYMRVIKLPGGHHFDGDYDGLARVILREVGGRR